MAATPHFFGGGDWGRNHTNSGASSPVPGIPRQQGGFGTGLGPGSDQDGSRRSSLFLDEARQFVEKGSVGNSHQQNMAPGARSISPNPAGTIGGHRSANTSRGVSPVNPYPPPKGDFRSSLAYNAFRSSSPSFMTAHSQQGSGFSEQTFDAALPLQQPSASHASAATASGDLDQHNQYSTPRLNFDDQHVFTESISQGMARLTHQSSPDPHSSSSNSAGDRTATAAEKGSELGRGDLAGTHLLQGPHQVTSERDGAAPTTSEADGNSPRSHAESLGPNRSLGSDAINAPGATFNNMSRPSSIYSNGPLPRSESTTSLPWRGGSGLPQSGGSHNGSMTNLAGGLLAPNATTSGALSGSSGSTPQQQSSVAFPSVNTNHADTERGTPSDFDVALRNSSLVADLCDRLGRVEAGMKDISRQMGGLTRNVSLLLERAKQQGSGPASPMPNYVSLQGQGLQQRSGATEHAPNILNSSDDVRALSSQLSTLSSSVAQLLAMQGGGGSIQVPQQPSMPNYAQSHSSRRSPSPMAGHQQSFPITPLHAQDSGRLSPHTGGLGPGARMSWGGAGSIISGYGGGVGGPGSSSGSVHDGPANGYPRSGKDLSDRRWSSLNQSNVRRDSLGTPTIRTPDIEGSASRFAGGSGGTNTESSVVATKWEHLHLHSDLLRSITKYGLGPPNKIQQRALPFLLRGNDIIAQAPPTQERIASYVIPVLQLVLTALREPNAATNGIGRGPIALIISTTVDQATQAQRMVLGLGSGLGVRVHIAAAGSIDAHQEATAVLQASPHIIVGTPRKMTELFQYISAQGPGPNSVPITDVRLVVLDEADQLIARNLSDYVSSLLRLLPLPRSLQGTSSGGSMLTPGLPQSSAFGAPDLSSNGGTMDRQTAIFSNTVPQDVLNFAQSIHLRESVRVLVRREGTGPMHSSSGQSGSGGTQSGGTLTHHHPGPPSNAMGATPMNANANPMADPIISSLRGLRQYYLYVAVSGNAPGMNPSGFGNAATEMKLDVITDLLEDIDFGQAVIYCGSSATLESVTYKVASKGIEALALHKDMANVTRQQVLAKFRSASVTPGFGAGPFSTPTAGRGRKALIVYDVAINPRDVHQVPLIVFYDLPRSVDEYKEKIACAAAGGAARPSVCVNVVTASGGPKGDIEMLRTLECHLGCKMAELPMDPKQILHF